MVDRPRNEKGQFMPAGWDKADTEPEAAPKDRGETFLHSPKVRFVRVRGRMVKVVTDGET